MDLKVKIKENLLEGEKICIKICYNNMVRIFVKKSKKIQDEVGIKLYTIYL